MVGPKLVNHNAYNWIHIGKNKRVVLKVGDIEVICDRVRSEVLTKR